MKKLLIVLLLLVPMLACAQAQILYRDNAIASWTAPTVPALLPGEAFEYDVYLSNVALGNPALLTYTQFVYVGRAITNSITINISLLYPRLAYYLVVRSILIRADDSELPGERGDSLNNADPTSFPAGFYYAPLEGTPGAPLLLQDLGM